MEEIKCYNCDKLIRNEEHPPYCPELRTILENPADMEKCSRLCDYKPPEQATQTRQISV